MKYLLLLVAGLVMFAFAGAASAQMSTNYDGAYKTQVKKTTYRSVSKKTVHYGNYSRMGHAKYDNHNNWASYHGKDYDHDKMHQGSKKYTVMKYRAVKRVSYVKNTYTPYVRHDYDYNRYAGNYYHYPTVVANYDSNNCGCNHLNNWNNWNTWNNWNSNWNSWDKCGCNHWNTNMNWNNWHWNWDKCGFNHNWNGNNSWQSDWNWGVHNTSWGMNNWNPCHERAPCGYGVSYSY